MVFDFLYLDPLDRQIILDVVGHFLLKYVNFERLEFFLFVLAFSVER